MEDNTMNPAEELKGKIDASIETKANEVADAANEALETKASEINEVVKSESTTRETNDQLLQKQIDELSNKIDSVSVAKTTKIEEKMTLKSFLESNVEDLKRLKSDRDFTMYFKNTSSYNPSAGANSAPYRDDRQSEIEYAPHQASLAQYFMQRTGSGGAYRLSTKTEATSTNGAAGKAKGAALGTTRKDVADTHVPYITVGHILTIPKEDLEDTTMLESYIQEEMFEEIVDTINNQVLVGAGGAANLRGIRNWAPALNEGGFDTFFGGLANTYGTAANLIDVINAAQSSLKRRNYNNKKFLFVNPDTIAQIQALKATTNEYLLNTTMAPDGTIRMFLNGVQVIENSAVTSGTFYLYDESSLKFGIREGMNIEVGYTGDDWERHNVSIKAIMRCNLVSGKPTGIVSGTFADAISSLNA